MQFNSRIVERPTSQYIANSSLKNTSEKTANQSNFVESIIKNEAKDGEKSDKK